MMYKVINRYHENGITNHRKIERALDKRDTHEGDGWEVRDDDGNIWDRDFDGNSRILLKDNSFNSWLRPGKGREK